MKTNFHSWFHSFEFSLSKHVKLCTKEWVLCDDLAVMLLMVFFHYTISFPPLHRSKWLFLPKNAHKLGRFWKL